MEHFYKTLSSKIVHQNKWFKVRRDGIVRPNGKRGEYFTVMTRPSVFVVALTPKKEIYLVRQFRYPAKKFSWELPAGGSDGQKPLAAAKRELWEETGLRAAEWKKLAVINPMNGIADEEMYVYLATDLRQTQKNKSAEEGIVEIKKFSPAEIKKMVKGGKISDGQTLAALLLYLQNNN